MPQEVCISVAFADGRCQASTPASDNCFSERKLRYQDNPCLIAHLKSWVAGIEQAFAV